MKIKTMPELTVASVELETNMIEMHKKIGNLPQLIVKESVKSGMHPTGPQHWVYIWNSLDPQSDFKLKICLPVNTSGPNSLVEPYVLERFDPFNCIEIEHIGPWETLKEGYNKLISFATANHIELSNVCREVYYNCDFINPANNITFIQMGIKA